MCPSIISCWPSLLRALASPRRGPGGWPLWHLQSCFPYLRTPLVQFHGSSQFSKDTKSTLNIFFPPVRDLIPIPRGFSPWCLSSPWLLLLSFRWKLRQVIFESPASTSSAYTPLAIHEGSHFMDLGDPAFGGKGCRVKQLWGFPRRREVSHFLRTGVAILQSKRHYPIFSFSYIHTHSECLLCCKCHLTELWATMCGQMPNTVSETRRLLMSCSVSHSLCLWSEETQAFYNQTCFLRPIFSVILGFITNWYHLLYIFLHGSKPFNSKGEFCFVLFFNFLPSLMEFRRKERQTWHSGGLSKSEVNPIYFLTCEFLSEVDEPWTLTPLT